MKQNNDKNVEYMNDDEQDVLQGSLGALDRTLEAKIKDSSAEETKYIQLYYLMKCLMNTCFFECVQMHLRNR